MASATAIATRPLIELHMEGEEDGVVTPVVRTSWSFTDQLVNKLAKRQFTNPYLIITVGYETIGDDFHSNRKLYNITKVYVRKLLDDAPVQHVQFARPGTNIVQAFVINVASQDDESTIKQWQRNPELLDTQHIPETDRYKIFTESYRDKRFNIDSYRHDVIVPEQLFAPEPPEFAKALVRQFARGAQVDQCDFRRRFLISLALNIPFQAYGIFARLFSLLYAIVFAKRDISIRRLFALSPHTFGRYLGTSFWYNKVDENGWQQPRTSLLKWLSPPQLLVYAVIMVVALLPGYIITVFFHSKVVGENRKYYPFEFSESLVVSAIIDSIFLAIVLLVFFFGTEKGTQLRRSLIHKFARKNPPKAPVVLGDAGTIELLRKQVRVVVNVSPERVANKTIRLKFMDLKMKVCKPFARN